MSLQDILNNKDYKIIFLRAILLGMKYSEGNNPNFYKNNIKNELDKLISENKSNNNDTNSNNDTIINNNYTITNNTKTDNEYNIKNKNDNMLIKILEKYEKNIINLENKKNYLISYIKSLKSKNYSHNFSRINLLNNNLELINKEIEKYIFILKKHNIKFDFNKENNTLKDNTLKDNTLKDTLKDSTLKDTLKDNTIKDNNVVKDLEKTLNNLSNLLIV
jgi:hypothetical protein